MAPAEKHEIVKGWSSYPVVRGAMRYVRVLHLRGELSNLCVHAGADTHDSKEAEAMFWEVVLPLAWGDGGGGCCGLTRQCRSAGSKGQLV